MGRMRSIVLRQAGWAVSHMKEVCSGRYLRPSACVQVADEEERGWRGGRTGRVA